MCGSLSQEAYTFVINMNLYDLFDSITTKQWSEILKF